MAEVTRLLPIDKCNLCDGIIVGRVEFINNGAIKKGVAICNRKERVIKIQDAEFHPVSTVIKLPDWCPLVALE